MADSPAGISIASRTVLGTARHIDTAELWIQERVANRDISIHKAKGIYNPADMFTTYSNEAAIGTCMESLGCADDDDDDDVRSDVAPRVAHRDHHLVYVLPLPERSIKCHHP